MTLQTGLAALIAALDAENTPLDGGTFEVRTGAPPATPAAADSGTKLSGHALGTPAFAGAAANGNNARAVANAIADDADADADGVAGHFRAKTAGGVVVRQGTITAAGGGGDAIINNVNIQIHGRVRITSWAITQPM